MDLPRQNAANRSVINCPNEFSIKNHSTNSLSSADSISDWIELINHLKLNNFPIALKPQFIKDLKVATGHQQISMTSSEPSAHIYCTKIEFSKLKVTFQGKSSSSVFDSRTNALNCVNTFFDKLICLIDDFKRDFSSFSHTPYELCKKLAESNPEIFKFESSNFGNGNLTIVEVCNIVKFEEISSNSEHVISRKVVHFLAKLCQIDSNHQEVGENEAVRLSILIKLIANFNVHYEFNKCRETILNQLNEVGPTKITISTKPYYTYRSTERTFRTVIEIANIATFSTTSDNKQMSKHEALSKIIRFLKNLSHLIDNFKEDYKNSRDSIELIEALLARNYEMIRFEPNKVSIELVNICVYSEPANSDKSACKIVCDKAVNFLKKLSQIKDDEICTELPLKSHITISAKIRQIIEHFLSLPLEVQTNRWQIVDSLNEKGLPTNVTESVSPCPMTTRAKHKTTIEIANLFQFLGRSHVKRESYRGAAFQMITFIKKLINLMNDFKSYYSKGKSPSEIFKCLHSKYSLLIFKPNQCTIEFVQGICAFTGDCKENVIDKFICFLKLLERSTLEDENELDNKVTIQSTQITKVTNEQDNFILFETLLRQFRSIHLMLSDSIEMVEQLMAIETIHPIVQCEQMQFGVGRYICTITVSGQPAFVGVGKGLLQAKQQVCDKLVDYLKVQCQISNQTEPTEKPINAKRKLVLKANKSKAIYEAVLAQWKQLAKPMSQFKIIAAFVVTSKLDVNMIRVLSIGTGSKCVFSASMLNNRSGEVVLDSHAEIIARRALLCVLYENLELHSRNGDNQELILEPVGGSGRGYRLKPHLRLHLYINSPPCGDARMFQFHPICNKNNNMKEKILRVKMENVKENIPMPKNYMSAWDEIQSGDQGSVFMTCSDKIAMWNVVGVQGSLLSAFIEPIYLHSLVVSELFHVDNISRALYGRIEDKYLRDKLKTLSNGARKYSLNCHKLGYYRPDLIDGAFVPNLPKKLPISHNWFQWQSNKKVIPVEMINSQTGKINSTSGVSRLAKRSLLKRYQKLIRHNSNLQSICDLNSTLDTINNDDLLPYYRGLKNRSIEYYNVKRALKDTIQQTGLGTWIRAPIQVNLFPVN